MPDKTDWYRCCWFRDALLTTRRGRKFVKAAVHPWKGRLFVIALLCNLNIVRGAVWPGGAS
ncbi:hypothetical protein BDZ85DRAFT_261551 [Elsinoe ampelina]|uniref:Uncharacterized protein n=1 Tax=Elsinoe ampelina TaxID=302913 RepID=A0A6A6GCR0_9PEZI|nr:hypothetical protein BDZ85DRAFT_261551 [Elsinoe ampelina]